MTTKLPSLNTDIIGMDGPKIPSFNQQQQTIPPPAEESSEPENEDVGLPIKETKEMKEMKEYDSDDKIDEDDDSIDSILTEEGFEEVPMPEGFDIMNVNISTRTFKSTNDSNKIKHKNRSLRIIKQIVEPFEDPDGNDIFEKEMESIETKERIIADVSKISWESMAKEVTK